MHPVVVGGLVAAVIAGGAALAIVTSALRGSDIQLPPEHAATRRSLGTVLAAFAGGLALLGVVSGLVVGTTGSGEGSAMFGLPVALALGLGMGAAAWGVALGWRRAAEAIDERGDLLEIRRRAIVGGAVAQGIGVVCAVGLLLGAVGAGR